MILRSIEFTGSAVDKLGFPQNDLPQIVFSGRSNVGKSSFINAMLNRKKIARVSQTPGKTRLVNFFLVNQKFYFVDIPGYGYAKISKKMIEEFQIMIEAYLESFQISLTVLLLDIRRLPNQDDLLMYEYFKAMKSEVLIVLTKSDKLSNNQKFNQVKKIKSALKARHEDRIVTFSSETFENRDTVWDIIEDNVSRHSNG
ncbi:ribosome biogenesis GTP-binding protein YihA/YsxC [Mycoplasmatota bacterium WC30]